MDQLYHLVHDLLKTMINDAVQVALSNNPPYPPSPKTNNENNVLTRKQAAEYLQVSPNTLTRYARQGRILPAVICGKYRFFKSDLEKFLKKNSK